MAIVERREIAFDSQGVLTAVACSAHAAARFGLPAATATGVVFRPDAGCVEIAFGAGDARPVVRLQAETLGALLVFFCMGRGVPLPRGAEKAVQVEPGAVILKFRKELGGAPKTPVQSRPSRKSMSWATGSVA